MVERRFSGRSASTGMAIGPLVQIVRCQSSEVRNTENPADEQENLRVAMAKAGADLEALADVASGDGADILAFQIEMLTDPALIEDVLVMIGSGQTAFSAWEAGLKAQIEDYEAADDDYFKARASDLADLKDRVARALMGVEEAAIQLPDGAILMDLDLTPSRFLGFDPKKLGGIALIEGSANSHVAMLARARGIPMLVGLGTADDVVAAGDGVTAIIDADRGLLVVAPASKTHQAYEAKLSERTEQARTAAAKRHQPAVTKDGQRIEVLINVDDPKAIDDEMLRASDGIGLLRTEFLFLGRSDLPNENEQHRVYADLVDRLAGRPVIIRTLDVGGDKPLAGVEQAKEANPFLGLRGIRFCLEHEALFRPQVRALLRAAAGRRSVQVMLPMVTVQAEIDGARSIFESCLQELRAEGVPAEMPPIGIMVETPAAAVAIDQLDAAFYSIGSNDLIQYVMAAARDASGVVADLLDPAHPAIIRLIDQVVAHGRASGKEVSLCGDMASDSGLLPELLCSNLRKISVAPAALDRIKAAIAGIDLGQQSTTRP